jgi:tetratricopeptide (TPR) repeat protein
VVDRGAAIGKELWASAVASLLPDDAAPFAVGHLEALVRKELLSPARSVLAGERAYRFRHILIQQAAYRAIPSRLRAALHEGFANWLEDLTGPGAQPELAGYHLEQAYRYGEQDGGATDGEHELAARAADRLALAGRRAFDRGDMPAAAGLLRRAVSLLDPSAGEAPMLLSDLGYALFEIGELRRAEDALAEAEQRARVLGDRAVEWSAAVKRGNTRIYAEAGGVDLDSLEDGARRAIEALTALEDDPGLARGWTALAEVLYLRGSLAESGRATRRAAEHARRAGSRREEAWALGEYGLCLYEGPARVSDAIRELQGILAESEGDPIMAANMEGFLALQEGLGGRIDSARRRVAKSLGLTRDLGLRWQVAIHVLLSAYIELLAGSPAAAERRMLEAREAFREIGDRWFLSTVSVDLPRAVHEQGRDDEALALVAAIDELPAPWDLEWQIKRRGVRSLLLARSGSREEALGLARDAVALAAESEFLRLHGEALLDLAEVLEIAGRPEDAAAAAGDGLRVHERKGNVVGASRARALLARSPAP